MDRMQTGILIAGLLGFGFVAGCGGRPRAGLAEPKEKRELRDGNSVADMSTFSKRNRSSVMVRKTPTILALGDSITAGGKGFPSYREVLATKLRNHGIAFEFIGPIKDPISAHAGYGGQSTEKLLHIVKKLYCRYPADIVLLHSGHNSFSKDKPVSTIVRCTEEMIQHMAAANPGVTVLLAQVIPAGKLPKYSYIPALNEQLGDLAVSLAGRGYRVILVDQAKGFDWRTDTLSDKVHPNVRGAEKMAGKWMDALLGLLKTDGANKPDEGDGK